MSVTTGNWDIVTGMCRAATPVQLFAKRPTLLEKTEFSINSSFFKNMGHQR